MLLKSQLTKVLQKNFGFTNQAKRLIYTKGTDLDTKNYSKEQAEEDLLIQYFENYLKQENNDQAEVQSVQERYNQLIAKRARQQSQQTQQVPAFTGDGLNDKSKFVSPQKMKEIFNFLTYVETNPNSAEAQKYSNQLEELERKNKNKKASQILIKTMKKSNLNGDMLKIEIGDDGKPLSEEDALFRKKNVDFTQWKFQEINSLKYEVKDIHSNKMLHMQTYRQPAAGECKGVVHFICGYGDYVGRYAYIAQKFANEGYDFIGIDSRGFGLSEGRRGIYEDYRSVLDDQLGFAHVYDKTFGSKLPRFLLGQSLGGFISLSMVAEQPKYWNGTSLVVPFLGLSEKDQAMMDKYKPLAKILNYFAPTTQFDARKGRRIRKWIQNWADDPLYSGKFLSAHNISNSDKNLKHFNENVADKVQTPFMMILGGQDSLVDNKASRSFFENSELKDKDLIQYDDADHCILQDAEYWKMVAMDIISWQNTHR